MKGLQTLLKLHKTKIDDIIIKINQLENTKISIETETINLINTINQELELFHNTEYSFYLDNFVNSARKKRELLKSKLIDIENNIAQKQEELFIEFSDQKKIEILMKNRLRTREEALAKKEEIVLNDNILMKYNYDKKL
jgi:hypothetical protein